MKKIMFNDRFGLTDAVLSGRKTMTRRIIKGSFEDVKAYPAYGGWHFVAKKEDGHSVVLRPPYEVGEKVAVAQSYENIYLSMADKWLCHNFLWCIAADYRTGDFESVAGWRNKMFVKAAHMSHHIRITGVRAERLNDITDGDCFREGIIHVEWKQWLEQDWDDVSPQRYKLHDLYTLPKFEEELLDSWAEGSEDCLAATTPQAAFTVLMWKISGKKLWQQNPWVWVCEFKLED